ncbi:MAG: hypothetical protein IJV40_06020 [Oscillospiraceae bacterium]|nr:hypothetical protein [Oscillospiraceae bacterium]
MGYNTPAIIRFPFERMTEKMSDAKLVRIGRSRADVPAKLKAKGISIDDGIQAAMNAICQSK